MRRRIRRRQSETPELDITAFLNLMVILVPFLLITAVFSRITIVDLYLPPESQAESSNREKFRLEIIIRKNQIGIYEASSGLSKVLRAKEGVFNFEQLSEHLTTLKSRFPKQRVAAILAEPDVSYDVLVQVMDHVRMRGRSDESGRAELSTIDELFPGISIGDAPAKSGIRK